MKNKAKLLCVSLIASLALQLSSALADSENRGGENDSESRRGENGSSLSVQWWQWALSIPTSRNPLLDTTGANCMVGQQGSTWFLAGLFGGGGPIIRNCTVPDNVSIFFPLVNSINFNAPNICGQGPANISVADLRAGAAPFIDGAISLLVDLDGKPVRSKRVRSQVFVVALPEDNIFDAPCATLGGAPGGIFSPAIDDGYYAQIESLKPGVHTLHVHAENPSAQFLLDVTYNLTVVHALLK
jgi:hypothetical protein